MSDTEAVQEDDIVREFLVESNENLNRLDEEILELERRPGDATLIASVFRTVHTIKGSCGFLGFSTLEGVAHQAESLLSQVRSGERAADCGLISLVLTAVDAIRLCLGQVQANGSDAGVDCARVVELLRTACQKQQAPPPPVPENVTAEGERGGAQAEGSIRIDVGLLDKLMNLVGELVLARNQVLQFTTQKEDAALNATSQRLNLITSELQESVMKTRMQPIGVVWNKLPRLVRDVALARGKQVRLEMDGSETELDKTLIEAIKDPIIHVVRNCCDHGIEAPEERARAGKPAQGTIFLKAFHEGGQVNIEIGDDGAGVDLEQVKRKAIERGLLRAEQAEAMSEQQALHLILLPGVTTAQTVTNISGRGVGMDVVKTNIEKIGGTLDMTTVAGRGTTFKLKIPLTLAIIPGLIVTSGGQRFIIPQVSLVELIRLDNDSAAKIELVHGTPVYRRRGRLLPVAHLNQVLGLEALAASAASNLVVVQVEDHHFGLVVEGIQDTQEIVVKPLGKQLKGLSVYAGATILGDGRVALILDVVGIGQRSGVLAQRAETARGEASVSVDTASERQRLLLFRAGKFERIAVPLALVGRLEEFAQSLLERAGTRRVVQYRGQILDLVSLASLLDPAGPDTAPDRDPIQVVVFTDGARSLGLIVDAISDILEDRIEIRQGSSRAGLLGSAVLANQVTDFLDVRAVLEAASEGWLEAHGPGAEAAVLVAEPSAFRRGLLRSELEIAGYRVLEASGAEQALRILQGTGVDALVAAADLPGGLEALAPALHERRKAGRAIHAIALASQPMEPAPDGFAECLVGSGRDSMLASLARLGAAVNGSPAGREQKEGCRL